MVGSHKDDFNAMKQVIVKRLGYFHSVGSKNILIAVIFPREGNCPEIGFYPKSEVVDIEL